MHPPQMRARARALRARGHDIHSLARTLSSPDATVRHRCVDGPVPAKHGTQPRCLRCPPDVDNPTGSAAYAYLLGLYLGDGQLAVAPKVPVQRIIESHPGDFLRGLFHSGGRRVANRLTTRGKVYVYPRYLFVTESADIMGLCQWALDLLGIAWRMSRRDSLSVARRAAVAALHRHLGPTS